MSGTGDSIGDTAKSAKEGTKEAAHDGNKYVAKKMDDMANVNTSINDE